MLQETNSSVPSTTSRKDIRYEVLDLNSQGMYLCQQQQFEEAHAMLSQAYRMLEEDTTLNNARASDELRSTTLNNLGVVECHMGQHRQALTHLDVAQSMERQWGIHSASVCLNICAACNALQLYDRASAAALDTIHLLRQQAKTLEVQQQVAGGQADPAGSWKQSSAAEVENNSVLWGAAWHNLAIAQLNSADGNDLSEYTNALVMFQNAMKATSDLLGMDHPMTLAVHETYRAVRADLRRSGAYKQHRTLLTAPLPPISGRKPLPSERDAGKSLTATVRAHERDLHVTIRGKQTKGVKQVERYNVGAYDELVPKSPRQQVSPRTKSVSPRRISTTSTDKRGLTGIPLSGNLLSASTLYRNPHPLLLLGGSMDRITPAAKAQYVKLPHTLPAMKQSQASQPQGGTMTNPQAVIPSEMLMGDMWVEAPRQAPAYMQSPQRNGTGEERNSPPRTVRPVYSQQLYVLPDADHRVSQPQDYAHVDHGAEAAVFPPPQQQQQPAAPKAAPPVTVTAPPPPPPPPVAAPAPAQPAPQAEPGTPQASAPAPPRTPSAGSRPALQQLSTGLSQEKDMEKYQHLRTVLKNDETQQS